MATGLVEEMDLNPVSLYAKGAIVLDAKMKLRMPQSERLYVDRKMHMMQSLIHHRVYS